MKKLNLKSYAQSIKILLSFLLSIILFQPLLAADPTDPDTLIRSTSQDILQIIKSDTKGDNRKIRDQVENRVMHLADFDKMTAFAVGRPWRTATSDQKKILIKEFRTLLARTYLSALSAYKSAALTFKPARYNESADTAIVRVDVIAKSNTKPIALDFSLEKVAQGWKVFDISVDGISFMTNHRSQFMPILSSQGIEGLIKHLVERNTTASSSQSSESNSGPNSTALSQ